MTYESRRRSARRATSPKWPFLAILWLMLVVQAGAWQSGNRLTPEQTLKRFEISDLDFSADQRYVAMTVTEPVKDAQRTSNVWVYDTHSKSLQRFTASDKSDTHPRWSPDGKRLAFLSNRTGTTQIYLIRSGGGEGEGLTVSETPINSFEWSPDGARIAFLSPDPVSEEEKERREVAVVVDRDAEDPRLRVIDLETEEVEDLTPDLLRTSEFAWMPKSDQLLLSATGHPRRDLDQQVTHFNRAWGSIPLVAPEIVRYSSLDGKEIEAALLKPVGYQAGSRVPFVVLVHGGPSGLFADRFHAWSQLLAARGYAVLLPNVRGSLGYGHDFLTSNRYDWAGGDWQDVMAGVDSVIDQGIADPEREPGAFRQPLPGYVCQECQDPDSAPQWRAGPGRSYWTMSAILPGVEALQRRD